MVLSRRAIIAGLGLTVVAGRVPRAQAVVNEAVAVQLIQDLSARAIGTFRRGDLTAEQREAVLRDLFNQGFDLQLIGRVVLGKSWRRATPAQQRDYQALFSLFVVQSFSNRLAGYAGETIAVTGTRPAGKKDIYVDSRINRPSNAPVKAAWRVRNIGGQPRVIDIVVEGISLTLTQRDEFAAVIKKNGVDGLLEVLRAKTQRLSAQQG